MSKTTELPIPPTDHELKSSGSARSESAAQEGSVFPSSRPHLLIAEDEPILLHILQSTLEYGGFSTDAVSTGLDCLKLVQERHYDALVLDLGLPDIDGVQIIKLIRSATDLPIIVVSGRPGGQSKTNALDLGADDFVEKPFDPGELIARIRIALKIRSTSSQARLGRAKGG